MTKKSELSREALADFAEELRAHREARGWTRAELAAQLQYSESLIAQIESCDRVPQKAFALKCDEVFKAPGTFKRLERKLHGVPFSAGFRPFEPYEAVAATLKLFEHTVFPGLFQTEDYARALLEKHPDTPPEVVAERIEARLKRQGILVRESPQSPIVWSLVDEQVLYKEVGGPEVMRVQLAHVLHLAHQPNITVQVIPSNVTHPGVMGAFAIAVDVPQVGQVAYLEDAYDGQTLEDPGAVSIMAQRWDAIRTEALSGTATLDLLEKTLETLEEKCKN